MLRSEESLPSSSSTILPTTSLLRSYGSLTSSPSKFSPSIEATGLFKGSPKPALADGKVNSEFPSCLLRALRNEERLGLELLESSPRLVTNPEPSVGPEVEAAVAQKSWALDVQGNENKFVFDVEAPNMGFEEGAEVVGFETPAVKDTAVGAANDDTVGFVNNGTVGAANDGADDLATDGTVGAAKEGAVGAAKLGTAGSVNKGTVGVGNEGTVGAENEGTVDVATEGNAVAENDDDTVGLANTGADPNTGFAISLNDIFEDFGGKPGNFFSFWTEVGVHVWGATNVGVVDVSATAEDRPVPSDTKGLRGGGGGVKDGRTGLGPSEKIGTDDGRDVVATRDKFEKFTDELEDIAEDGREEEAKDDRGAAEKSKEGATEKPKEVETEGGAEDDGKDCDGRGKENLKESPPPDVVVVNDAFKNGFPQAAVSNEFVTL